MEDESAHQTPNASSAEPSELKPSIMIRVLHNMIGRFWNLTL